MTKQTFEDFCWPNRVFLCGNGGSATNATHIANDLISVGVAAHSLTADVATLTAIANDFGYERVFSRQLQVLANKGDTLIALSGSGKSPNIIHAITTARYKGMEVWAFFGGYHVHCLEGVHVICRGRDMQEAEEIQLQLGHELMRWLKPLRPC